MKLEILAKRKKSHKSSLLWKELSAEPDNVVLYTSFSLNNVYKRVSEICFYFVYISSYFQKLKIVWFVHTQRNQVFYIFINN